MNFDIIFGLHKISIKRDTMFGNASSVNRTPPQDVLPTTRRFSVSSSIKMLKKAADLSARQAQPVPKVTRASARFQPNPSQDRPVASQAKPELLERLNRSFKQRTPEQVAALLARNNSEAQDFDRPTSYVVATVAKTTATCKIVQLFEKTAVYTSLDRISEPRLDGFCVQHLYIRLRDDQIEVPFRAIFSSFQGSAVTKYLAQHLAEDIKVAIESSCFDGISDKGLWDAFKRASLVCNERLCSKIQGGAGALVTLVIANVLWTLNVGEARGLLVEGNSHQGLSRDQALALCQSTTGDTPQRKNCFFNRPTNANGQQRDWIRVAKRGAQLQNGLISPCFNRIAPAINAPRGFGFADTHALGIRLLSPKPEITRHVLSEEGSILILATARYWDKISSAATAQVIHQLQSECDLAEARCVETKCQILVQQYLSIPDSTDNIILMVAKI